MRQTFFYLLTILMQISSSIFAQSTDDTLFTVFDNKYGTDQDLICGEKYFTEHTDAFGHPFWKENKYTNCNIMYNNKLFKNVKLKYNLLNQQFILSHPNKNKPNLHVILINDKIDTVWINNSKFVYDMKSQKFYQNIYNGSISCFFYWNKEFSYKNSGAYIGHTYSKDLCTAIIKINNHENKFTNNRTFIKAFPKHIRAIIHKYIVENGINLRHRNESQIINLLSFCNNLSL